MANLLQDIGGFVLGALIAIPVIAIFEWFRRG